VLLVEDNARMRILSKRLAGQQLDSALRVVKDGAKAIEFHREHGPSDFDQFMALGSKCVNC